MRGRRVARNDLEHDPEKACPGLDPGWKPVFGKDHAQTKILNSTPMVRVKSVLGNFAAPLFPLSPRPKSDVSDFGHR
jgi:hypothetical protein